MDTVSVAEGKIGQPVRRKEDQRLVIGAGNYTSDVSLPGQLHAVIVRSPHAHARIRTIDAGEARQAPGVVDVLTGAELEADGIGSIPSNARIPGLVDVPLDNRDGSDRRVTPIPLLAAGKVRFVGDAVAAVIGESLNAALDAAERVAVDYEVLPAVTATRAAAERGAPRVWEAEPNNVCVDAEFGDRAAADAAFARADHVVKFSTTINRVTGVMMETRGAVCHYEPARGTYTMYCGGDNSVRLKRDLAVVLAAEQTNIRVITRDVGGNFGTRNWFYPEYGIVAWASRRLGRPVRWQATRSEGLLADYQGRDLVADAELALDRHGNFLGLRGRLISNVGAYVVTYVPLNKTSELLNGVYRIPAIHVESLAVVSNTSPTAPYRSAGRPEAMFIMERLIDCAAREHGFDRLELRRRNLIPSHAMPFRTPLGLTYDSGEFALAMDKALALADWRGFPKRRREARRRGRLRGFGFANYIEVTSGFPIERSEITVSGNGTVDVVIGTTPSGQGHETSFAQCVAEWLGVRFGQIRLIYGDTAVVKEGGGSHSARSMRMAGIVMGKATDVIIERGRRIASHLLESAADDVEFSSGCFIIKGTDRRIGIFDVARAAEQNDGLPDDLRGPLFGACTDKMQVPGYPYGAQACEVEVDPDTGNVEVVAVVAVDDVGRAINPLILHGQTHGAVAQGYGQALMEHAYYDAESGQMLAGSLMDYAMPRACHFPSIRSEIMEVPTPTNKLGVRGGGEGGTTPALAVVVSAITDALLEYGVCHVEMPATSERVWRAIHRSTLGSNLGSPRERRA
jgi:aerobic carbon-monoxide dehydrogenase large subunit